MIILKVNKKVFPLEDTFLEKPLVASSFGDIAVQRKRKSQIFKNIPKKALPLLELHEK